MAPPNYSFQLSCLLVLLHAWTKALIFFTEQHANGIILLPNGLKLRMWNWNLGAYLHSEDFFVGLLLWLRPFKLEAHLPHGSLCPMLHSQMHSPLFQAFLALDSRSAHTIFLNRCYQKKPLKESPGFWHTFPICSNVSSINSPETTNLWSLVQFFAITTGSGIQERITKPAGLRIWTWWHSYMLLHNRTLAVTATDNTLPSISLTAIPSHSLPNSSPKNREKNKRCS